MMKFVAQILAQHQYFPYIRANQQRKPVELMPLANKNAWIQQNKDFAAAPPPKMNAWLKQNIKI